MISDELIAKLRAIADKQLTDPAECQRVLRAAHRQLNETNRELRKQSSLLSSALDEFVHITEHASGL